jgi:alpha,alpha-trehalase
MTEPTTEPMTPERRDDLLRDAQGILRGNDHGGYTVPTHGLYPYQWNWDAGFSALGWITFDEPRAWTEYRRLLEGQWIGGPQDGFLPSIVFHEPCDTYFPGPEEWRTPKTAPSTTSISQPPVHATMLRWMWQRARDKPRAEAALREILPAIARHHRWWMRTRDPQASGLVTVIHPWETGRDNSPAWDAALERVPRTTRAYARRDLDHVASGERPTPAFYDRVVWLMDYNRACAFDPGLIVRECPFRVVDCAIVFILHRATQDLLALADELAIPIERPPLEDHLARTEAATPRLWSRSLGQYVDFDLVGGAPIERPTSGGFLSWYAGIRTPTDQLGTLAAWLDETPFALPSTRSSDAAFEPKRYWRGPIWQHMNLLIENGLRKAHHEDLADRIEASSRELFEAGGFHEYHDPISGAGLGGRAFSWTAAVWLWRQAGGGSVG